MASDGLLNRAKTGTCRMCRRVRLTDKYLKAVGEVRHGFATGHIWECVDIAECDKVAIERMNDKTYPYPKRESIKLAFEVGRFKTYVFRS